MQPENSNFFRDASNNFGANNTTFGKYAANYSNGAKSEKSAYDSRLRSSLSNGAGPNTDPAAAPWSFTDFAFGRKSILGEKATIAGRKIGIMQILIVVGIGYLLWKWFK